jgi:hypothetical protein
MPLICALAIGANSGGASSLPSRHSTRPRRVPIQMRSASASRL